MTDYLGPLTLGTSGTYQLESWTAGESSAVISLVVECVSPAILTAAIEALVTQLRVGNTYARTFPSSAAPVVYSVLSVSEFTVDQEAGPLAFWARCKFTLALSANPAGALVTLYGAQHVDAPASLLLDTLLGTNPPTLDVTVDDDSGNDMHSVWCALAPTALSDTMWWVNAQALTWSTLTNGSGASWWGNAMASTTSASWQTANLDTRMYPAGKYRLLARVSQSAGTGAVKDAQNDAQVTFTRTTPHLVTIGDLDLPVANTAPGVAANLTLSFRSDGAGTATLNGFLLLPLDYGWFRWHPDVPTTELDQLDVGPSGVFMDGIYDSTYLRGGVLAPKTLAAHVGTLVATASPSGSNWPADWGRTDGTDVTADTSRVKVAVAAATKYGWYAATNAATPIVVPGAWYELSFLRQVTAWTSGAAVARLDWMDIDGNLVRQDALSSAAATDASPVAVTVYAQAPVHAARCQIVLGAAASTLTAYFSAVVLRRCPMRLIVVAEEASGTLVSYKHPVHVTVRYQPLYEVSR